MDDLDTWVTFGEAAQAIIKVLSAAARRNVRGGNRPARQPQARDREEHPAQT